MFGMFSQWVSHALTAEVFTGQRELLKAILQDVFMKMEVAIDRHQDLHKEMDTTENSWTNMRQIPYYLRYLERGEK